MKRIMTLLAVPWSLGMASRLVCVHIDMGLAALSAPLGIPPLRVFWLMWAAAFLAPGLAAAFTLPSGDARRYLAVRTLACAFGLCNLWPLLAAGRLWLNMSSLLCAAAVVLSAVCVVRFWRIDRRAGWCMAVFSAWTAYELYVIVGFAVLN